MATLYISQEGSYVRKEGERIKVIFEKNVLVDVPLLKVTQVALFGPVQVSTQALTELLKRDIDVVFLTKSGRFKGRLESQYSKNAVLRLAQLKTFEEKNKRLEIAKTFVFGKLSNMKTLLLRYSRYDFNRKIDSVLKQLSKSIKNLSHSETLEQVRGCEGAGSSFYFYAFKKFLKSNDFKFEGRIKRPPKDPINALLSFAYTLLFKDVISICELVGFDPYIGFLHSIKYGKAALALDLMEEWRPVIVDTLILSLINRGSIKIEDFEKCGSTMGIRIKEKAKRSLIEAYEKKKNSSFKHPYLGQKTSYWKALEIQARILARVVLGRLPTYKPFLIK